MVNAQQYIENNFPKRVSEIIAIDKDLEGRLDLSNYPNLTKVDVGINSRLIGLKLSPLSKITRMSIYGTGITDFSFLIDLPNITFFCFPKPAVSDGNNAEVARAIRDISQANLNKNGGKDQEIVRLQQQIAWLQSTNQQVNQNQQTISNLNQTLTQVNITNSQLNQQISQQQQVITQLQTELIREKDKTHLLKQLTQIQQPPK